MSVGNYVTIKGIRFLDVRGKASPLEPFLNVRSSSMGQKYVWHCWCCGENFQMKLSTRGICPNPECFPLYALEYVHHTGRSI